MIILLGIDGQVSCSCTTVQRFYDLLSFKGFLVAVLARRDCSVLRAEAGERSSGGYKLLIKSPAAMRQR